MRFLIYKYKRTESLIGRPILTERIFLFGILISKKKYESSKEILSEVHLWLKLPNLKIVSGLKTYELDVINERILKQEQNEKDNISIDDFSI